MKCSTSSEYRSNRGALRGRPSADGGAQPSPCMLPCCLLCRRAACYRFDADSTSWKERGQNNNRGRDKERSANRPQAQTRRRTGAATILLAWPTPLSGVCATHCVLWFPLAIVLSPLPLCCVPSVILLSVLVCQVAAM